MNLREALLYGERTLEEADISESKIDSWLLFEYVTKITRTQFFLESDKSISKNEFEEYKSMIEKRKTHYPLQYITHVQQFMGYDFYVDESVLIPRPETEELVELAIQNIDSISKVIYNCSKSSENRKINILDMCTGSGCIAISLALLCKNVDITAVDISEDALCVAKKNAEKLGVNVSFVNSDLFEEVMDEKFDIIVSNPPYIETKELRGLMDEVIEHEPVLALDGMEDGLFFYKKIINESVRFLNPGGKLLFEIGYNQGKCVSDLMKNAGFFDVKVIKDLSGLDRIVCGGI